jgi:hypothetical protein
MDGEYNREMDPELEAVFRMLDEVAEEAKSIRIEIDDEYRHAIELVEALPENQSGSDKTWVHRLVQESEAHFARARRTR